MGGTAEAAKCVVHLGRSHPREDPSCSGLVPTAKTTLNPAHDRPGKKGLAQRAANRRHHQASQGWEEVAPFLPARFCADTVLTMMQETVITKKRRGPAPTGKGTL